MGPISDKITGADEGVVSDQCRALGAASKPEPGCLSMETVYTVRTPLVALPDFILSLAPPSRRR